MTRSESCKGRHKRHKIRKATLVTPIDNASSYIPRHHCTPLHHKPLVTLYINPSPHPLQRREAEPLTEAFPCCHSKAMNPAPPSLSNLSTTATTTLASDLLVYGSGKGEYRTGGSSVRPLPPTSLNLFSLSCSSYTLPRTPPKAPTQLMPTLVTRLMP